MVAAENLLKRLAKEALRRGGDYMRLDEKQILARLEKERAANEEREKRSQAARREALPSVVARAVPAAGSGSSSSVGGNLDVLSAHSLSDLTPMQQKNLSLREEQHFRRVEQLRAKQGDGQGGLNTDELKHGFHRRNDSDLTDEDGMPPGDLQRELVHKQKALIKHCLLYTSPSPRD